MSHERKIGRAPNFTLPFLVSAGVLVFACLFWVRANWGMVGAVLAGIAADQLIGRWRR